MISDVIYIIFQQVDLLNLINKREIDFVNFMFIFIEELKMTDFLTDAELCEYQFRYISKQHLYDNMKIY